MYLVGLLPHEMISSASDNEMGGVGGVCEGEERCIEDIGGKTRRKETETYMGE
jgi:hypothetical protein